MMNSYGFGNKKLPSSTLIINMSSAQECSMREQCQFSAKEFSGNGKCYALKAERMYPNVRNSRALQTEYWRTTDNKQKLKDFADLFRKHPRKMNTITAVRFNESGDMREVGKGGEEDLAFLIELAKTYGSIVFYTYTHNKELMRDVWVTDLPDNLAINLSYKNYKNGFNSFRLDTEYNLSDNVIECCGDCRVCSLCQENGNLNIAVSLH
jgi:hypothetical protein